jgi:hypothetical protein
MALSISQLPVELIHTIALSFDTNDRRSACCIVRLGSASRRLHSTLQEPHIWRVLYREQYMHANPDSEMTRRAVRQEDYFLLFQDRRRLDTRLLSALDHLIDTGEREPLCRFVARHRYDIQDVLEYLPRPIPFGCPSLSRFISRRRWAAHSRVLLERLSAVDVFTSLKDNPDAVSFEDGLMALSQFEGISIKDVSYFMLFYLVYVQNKLKPRICIYPATRGRLAVTSDLPDRFAPQITVEAWGSSLCGSSACDMCLNATRGLPASNSR